MVKTKKWTLVNGFNGVPKQSDFKLIEEELPALTDGEVLVEAVYWSVDPYMRPYMRQFPAGSTMIGEQLYKVLESRREGVEVGSLWLGYIGWTTHSIVAGSATLTPMPALGDLPLSLALGAVGMPGATAYFGLFRLCEPKAGQTVLVNGAAGAVGSIVGQLAKIKGCKVVAYCGDDAKAKWIKEDLGFDHVFNYKKVDIDKTMSEAAPEGFDCFFDNVGSAFTSTALQHMKKFGRVAICGSISSYNATADDTPTGPYPYGTILFNELKVEGFLVPRWRPEWPEAFKELVGYINEGKLKYRETVTEGFEKMPEAFIGLFSGANTGKAVVKA